MVSQYFAADSQGTHGKTDSNSRLSSRVARLLVIFIGTLLFFYLYLQSRSIVGRVLVGAGDSNDGARNDLFDYYRLLEDPADIDILGPRVHSLRLRNIVHYGYPVDKRTPVELRDKPITAYVNVKQSDSERHMQSINRGIRGNGGTWKWWSPRSWFSFAEEGEEMPTFVNVGSTTTRRSLAQIPRKHDSLVYDYDLDMRRNDSLRAESARPKLIPDIRDPDTVLVLGEITNNAYLEPGDPDWVPISSDYFKFNQTFGFDGNGIRGHIYADDDAELVLIAFKGTSPSVLGIGGDTAANDRFIDNLMFSCCCARVNTFWRTVCDCYRDRNSTSGQQMCSVECLQEASQASDTYYAAAMAVYEAVRFIYPTSEIWFIGHSLGGALAALSGLTVGTSALAFESPGDRLYADRLGLDVDALDAIVAGRQGEGSHPAETAPVNPVIHLGNSADPIFMGECTGTFSLCALAGYAMESRCHMGVKCVYNIQGSGLDIQFHRLRKLLDYVLRPGDVLPICRYPRPGNSSDECVDCVNWDFISDGGDDGDGTLYQVIQE